MIQETSTQPPVAWSCNPLAFDFTQLFMKSAKPKKPETTGDQETKPAVEGSSSVDNGKYKMLRFHTTVYETGKTQETRNHGARWPGH